jgi:hypothetical protein
VAANNYHHYIAFDSANPEKIRRMECLIERLSRKEYGATVVVELTTGASESANYVQKAVL